MAKVFFVIFYFFFPPSNSFDGVFNIPALEGNKKQNDDGPMRIHVAPWRFTFDSAQNLEI